MGVISYEMEVTTPIHPAKMFKAFVLDFDYLIPKILPQAIKSVEIIKGDGGPGTVKLITFGEASQLIKSAKHQVDGIDKEKFTYNYTVIEGDTLMGKIEKISYETKFVASPDGGSICKSSSKYYTIGDFQLKEDQINGVREKALAMFKAVEAYLLANPDAY